MTEKGIAPKPALSSTAAQADPALAGSAPTIWFTGKPNAGKTTLALALAKELKARGLEVEILDGNELRQWLSSDLGFTPEDRTKHVLRVARLAGLLTSHKVWSLVAVIAPYRALRQQAREMLGGNVVEVFLDCPAEILAARDQKDLYQKALKGQIKAFTGISDPYEEPQTPQMLLRTDHSSVEDCCQQVLSWLKNAGLLPAADRG